MPWSPSPQHPIRLPFAVAQLVDEPEKTDSLFLWDSNQQNGQTGLWAFEKNLKTVAAK